LTLVHLFRSLQDLSSTQERKLTELFHKLDSNGDGELDMNEFRRLGEAVTGRPLSDEEVRGQLSRADADGNDKLDLDEWLAFGQVLGGMPDAQFATMIDTFIQRLSEPPATKPAS